MKVRELITALQSEEQEAVVVIDAQQGGMGFLDITDVRSIFIAVNEHTAPSESDYDRWGDIPAVHLSRT